MQYCSPWAGLSALWDIINNQPNLPISVTHVCDVNADKAKQTASALGCKSLSSFDDIFTVESNDFVAVLTPSEITLNILNVC